jgi:hypothetical protein
MDDESMFLPAGHDGEVVGARADDHAATAVGKILKAPLRDQLTAGG